MRAGSRSCNCAMVEPSHSPKEISAKRGPDQGHGLTSASQRTGNIVEVRGIAAVTREQVAQDSSAMNALRTAVRIEWHVVQALQAAGDVPLGLSVTDVIDRRPRLCRCSHELIFY